MTIEYASEYRHIRALDWLTEKQKENFTSAFQEKWKSGSEIPSATIKAV
jgi:hypothetical protein